MRLRCSGLLRAERSFNEKDGLMKEKLKDFFGRFSFRTLWDEDNEDEWEDFDTRDDYVSGADARKNTASSFSLSPAVIWIIVIGLAAVAFAGYQVSSRRHLYTSYKTKASFPGEDITGTSYVRLGNDFVKYGADGITLVNASNETLWSNAYTMKTTVSDSSSEAVLIYEQQGSQAAVADRSGVLGQFETDLPILKGSVAGNGVCAFLMKNDEDTLIRLYSPDGTILAEVKPTLEETGQPVALDLSEGATKLMVSMVKAGAGTVDSSVIFYDFSSTSESAAKHVTGNITYKDEVVPEVFFADDRTPVAVGSGRILVFSGVNDPSEKADISVGGEITSVFHDKEHIALIQPGDDAQNRYRLTVYNYRGEQMASVLFNESYDNAVFDSGEILLWSRGHMMAFTPEGVMRFDSDFEGKIELLAKTPGFRNYCVLSASGITRIKAE